MLGSEHKAYDRYTLLNQGNSVAAITSGRSKNHKNKESEEFPNEDSLGVVTLSNGWQLYMVADAHFGHHASEIAVVEFPKILEARLGSDIQKAMYESIFDLGDVIRNSKPRVKDPYSDANMKSMSETTFIAALKKGREVFYASVGDSFIYKLSNATEPIDINKMQHRRDYAFLGSNNDTLIDVIQNYFFNKK